MIAPENIEWLSCCAHCGCKPGEREGHDDSCKWGCNDDEIEAD